MNTCSELEIVYLTLRMMNDGIMKLIDRIMRLPQIFRKVSRLGSRYEIVYIVITIDTLITCIDNV